MFLLNKHVPFIFLPWKKNPTIINLQKSLSNIFKVLRTEKSSASRWKSNDTHPSSTTSSLRMQPSINSNPLKKVCFFFFVKVRSLSLPDYNCDSKEAYKISSNRSLHFEYFSNKISPKNKLTTKLCACEVSVFYKEAEGLWHTAFSSCNTAKHAVQHYYTNRCYRL